MDVKSREWDTWCRLDRYSRSRDRKEIEGLTADDIRKSLARAMRSDRGKASAYIVGEEVLREFDGKQQERKERRNWWRDKSAGFIIAIITGLAVAFILFFLGIS